jgi:HEAT repeat protein
MGVQSRVTRQIENFAHPNPETGKRDELRLLQYGRRAKPLLIHACKDPRPEVRFRAAWLLGKIGGADTFDAIFPLCWDEDEAVMYDARIALGRTGDPRAFDALIDMMREDREINSAVYGLDTIPGVDDHLLELLEDENFNVRWGAARTLRCKGDRRLVPWLEERMKSDNPVETSLAEDELTCFTWRTELAR